MTDFQYSPMQVEWLDRLASGETVQGKGRLIHNGAMCCIGVSCDMFAERLGMVVSDDDGAKAYDRERDYAPPKIVMAIGLLNSSGTTRSEAPKTSLAYKNDHALTHPEIAALIRSNPRTYLKEVRHD